MFYKFSPDNELMTHKHVPQVVHHMCVARDGYMIGPPLSCPPYDEVSTRSKYTIQGILDEELNP